MIRAMYEDMTAEIYSPLIAIIEALKLLSPMSTLSKYSMVWKTYQFTLTLVLLKMPGSLEEHQEVPQRHLFCQHFLSRFSVADLMSPEPQLVLLLSVSQTHVFFHILFSLCPTLKFQLTRYFKSPPPPPPPPFPTFCLLFIIRSIISPRVSHKCCPCLHYPADSLPHFNKRIYRNCTYTPRSLMIKDYFRHTKISQEPARTNP